MKVKTTTDYRGIGDVKNYLCNCDSPLLFYSNNRDGIIAFYCPTCKRIFDAELLECHDVYADLVVSESRLSSLRSIFGKMLRDGITVMQV